MRPLTLCGVFFLAPGIAFAVAEPPSLAQCATIADNSARLACYDRLAATVRDDTANANVPNAAPVPAQPETPATAEAPRDGSARHSLAEHWELTPETKRGVFVFRPHQQNYLLLANYSFAPNSAPFTPFAKAGLVPDKQGISHTELKFQLGFKMKLVEDVLPTHTDLWMGYTQQSYWQAYNRKASSPFRETDYQPEVMAVTPVDFRLLGMHARFVNVGLVHQSNGRAQTLSRSWNRVYAQLGLEKGNFTVLARAWKRINESASEDDNPDIVDYMGYGDIRGIYRWRGHEFSVLARQNFRTSRGATQLGWAFPVSEHLKGFVQVFSGYGQSLIDYNYSQKTIGFGVLIDY